MDTKARLKHGIYHKHSLINGWEKEYHINSKHQEVEGTILISDKVQTSRQYKQGHFKSRKIRKEDITITNAYAPYKSTSKYIKGKWTKLKREMAKPTQLNILTPPHK